MVTLMAGSGVPVGGRYYFDEPPVLPSSAGTGSFEAALWAIVEPRCKGSHAPVRVTIRLQLVSGECLEVFAFPALGGPSKYFEWPAPGESRAVVVHFKEHTLNGAPAVKLLRIDLADVGLGRRL